MHHLYITLFSLLTTTLCSPPTQHPLLKKPKLPTSLPVVLWHGLGDTYDSEGMQNIASLINETYPGTFIHSIYLDEDPSKDRNAAVFGRVVEQVLQTRSPATFTRIVLI
jgi:palmitoyl-protein thioesterase